MITRRPDWIARMNEALDAARDRQFSWGAWDCCLFVASVVERMTDTDPLVDYRGHYTDEASAWAALSHRDGNLRAACRRVFGGMVVAPHAKRGDVVLLRGGLSIGICLGRLAAFAAVDGTGLVQRPMADCAYAFPLGWPAHS